MKMSIFGSIRDAIFGGPAEAAPAPTTEVKPKAGLFDSTGMLLGSGTGLILALPTVGQRVDASDRRKSAEDALLFCCNRS
jgi:hypothetical protein